MTGKTLKDTGSAVIVGASLAGLITGIALARTGMKVTILERAGPKPRSGAVLQVDSGEFDLTATAKALRHFASGGFRSAQAWTSIQSRLCAEANADSGIALLYDNRIKSIGQDEKHALVITDKNDIYHGDIVIGADGHLNLVRGIVAAQKPDANFAGYLIWLAILNENDIPERYWPAIDAPVSMPNGIGDFLLGSVIASEDGSQERGQRRLGWAWYDHTRNSLLRELGCVNGNIVHHSLNGADISLSPINHL